MAGEVTYAQLMQSEFILRVFSQIKPQGAFFLKFTNTLPGQPAVIRVQGRNLGWDIFNATRLRAKGRAPMTGPAMTSRKPIGHVSAQAYRSHEKTPILDEEVYKGRPLGGAYGTVDVRGQRYVAAQMGHLRKKFVNSREFMMSRLFRGGFSISISGDDWVLGELGAGTFDVDMQIPASHLTFLEAGSGANIITQSWQDPSTDIISQFLNLNAAAVRETGMMIEHCIINSVTIGWLLNNVGLQAVGGSAYRIFDSMTMAEITGTQAEIAQSGTRKSGYAYVFRAIPNVTFHVYDEVDVPGETDSIALSASSKYVPDNKAIFCPTPDSEWIGGVEGSEVVRENVMDGGKEVYGFHPWTTPVIDPPGQELKMLDNWLPAIFVPRATYYGTIGGF